MSFLPFALVLFPFFMSFSFFGFEIRYRNGSRHQGSYIRNDEVMSPVGGVEEESYGTVSSDGCSISSSSSTSLMVPASCCEPNSWRLYVSGSVWVPCGVSTFTFPLHCATFLLNSRSEYNFTLSASCIANIN